MPKQDPDMAKPIALKKKASGDWYGIRLAYPMTIHTPRGDNKAGAYAWLVYNTKSREQLVMEDTHFRSMFVPRGKTSKDSKDWQVEGNWAQPTEATDPGEQEGQPDEDS